MMRVGRGSNRDGVVAVEFRELVVFLRSCVYHALSMGWAAYIVAFYKAVIRDCCTWLF
jgi:hypothetical protein